MGTSEHQVTSYMLHDEGRELRLAGIVFVFVFFQPWLGMGLVERICGNKDIKLRPGQERGWNSEHQDTREDRESPFCSSQSWGLDFLLSVPFPLFFDPEISKQESHPWGMKLLASLQPLLALPLTCLLQVQNTLMLQKYYPPTHPPTTNQCSLSGPRALSFLEVPLFGRTHETTTVAFSLIGNWPGPSTIDSYQSFFSPLPFSIRPKQPLVSSQSQHQLMLLQ